MEAGGETVSWRKREDKGRREGKEKAGARKGKGKLDRGRLERRTGKGKTGAWVGTETRQFARADGRVRKFVKEGKCRNGKLGERQEE